MDLTKQKAHTNEGMRKEVERIFDEFAKTLKKQVVSSPTENFIVDWKSKFKEFTSLVKRMREAQKGIYQAFTTSPKEVVDWSVDKARQLESEVDEYLEKMEI